MIWFNEAKVVSRLSVISSGMSKEEIILSIVIANYNYGRFLPCAIESVIRQCGAPIDVDGRNCLPVPGTASCVELIICDAASSDNSTIVIDQYRKFISWSCSEKDGGQSEAFNKGFSHARGKWLTWLNADEEYLPNTFRKLIKKINSNPAAKWITGNELRFDIDSRIITFVTWGPHIQPRFFTGNRACIAVFGPSSFIRSDVYDRIGKINEAFHYSMDLEYWARMTLAGIRQTRLNHICWAFGVHPDSISQGDMSKEKIAAGHAENLARAEVLGYTYSVSFRNPWYLLWMLFRLLDGSLIVRFVKRRMLIGSRFKSSMD